MAKLQFQKRKSVKDKLVDEMMARFDHGYAVALDRFETMERIQQAYDNNINTATWPTISEIGFPITFTSVEEQLPLAMKYLFPRNRFINLIPGQLMDADVVKRIENDLRYTIRTKMNAEEATLPSIKDCYKFGVGYGMIDVMSITPPSVTNNILAKGENVISQIPQMVLGAPVKVPVYRYISPCCVIPMPDGANVDGVNKASGHFVIDIMTESKFRALYEEKDSNGKPFFKGDPDKIVAQARSMNFDARALTADTIAQVAGFQMADINTNDRRIPVVVPVIKCFFDHEQVWIANGQQTIWHIKDKYQTLMSDLIKWSASPDGTRWFPMNITEASERLSSGINVWYNGMMDLAMYILNPARVINSDKVDHPDQIGRGPKSDIKVSGSVKDAVSYMELPQFPSMLDSMGATLERFHGNANASQQGVRNGQAGLVRGGTNALEQLMSTSTGRQFLAAIILKTGAMKPMVEKTLIKRQLLIDQSGNQFIEEDRDPDTGERIFVENNVTLEELRNVFQVELDMPAARLNSAASLGERTAYFDRAQRKPELFDDRALYEELGEDDAMVTRTMLPVNVVKERAARTAEAAIAAAERGEQPQGSAGGPSTQADQGAAGGAAANAIGGV